ncbi:MAG: Fe-S protein assembly co-chaperone HscB [Betaproteobacteria bacterium]|nr:Fe-S protein assembly co-chaperone HscB [Betaproteobacteria bacterium]
MNLQSDDFDLFGLPRSFAQDRAAVDAAWKALQRQAHPDKFAAEGAAAQRLAMQWSVRINEAYQRLKDPIRRAAYLCELAGFPIAAHQNTAMPAAFLMQQMEWHEALDEAESAEALETLFEQVRAQQAELLAACAQHIDVTHDYPAAVSTVRALMFVDKFGQDVLARQHALDA